MTTPDPSDPVPVSGAGLDLSEAERRRVLDRLAAAVEHLTTRLGDRPVTEPVTPGEVRAALADHDFEHPRAPEDALDAAVDLLTRYAVHVPHPRYFGLFNPAPAFMGVVADALTAAFNPQLAAWSHAPAAAEIERVLVRFLAHRLGLPGTAAGSFTSGGAEANQTGLLVALTTAFPELARTGLRGLDGQPTLYASVESHDTWRKGTRACGLGEEALRLVPVDDRLRLDVDALAQAVREDRDAGRRPFLVAATAGTTGAGAIDPLPELADLRDREGLYLHVDAAWAGAVALSDRLRPLLDGIDRADSVTVDAHKWLSVPMGAGVFLGTDPDALRRTFQVSTAYMPDDTTDAADPYAVSIQWSRRFTGLKLFLSLAVAGREGYARQLEHDCWLGDELRRRLAVAGWRIANDTPLPVVCVTDADDPAASVTRGEVERIDRIAATVVARGRVWLSSTRLRGRPALRACITSHRTTTDDLDVLVTELDAARREVDRGAARVGPASPGRESARSARR